jgi:hypothetical protein
MSEGMPVAVPAPRFSGMPGLAVADPSVQADRELLTEAGFSAAEISELAAGGIVGA